ncbi:hypothetical protein AGMMS49982_20840 [Bacteroidia bacterium]|nr:hypothetical protein AGMMS49982_20840 [Bacteroidia bacterium]
MKKTFLFFAVFAATALWTGCEPIVDKHDAGGSIAATELQATATSVVKDGKNTNKVYVHCTSPVLCQWSDGVNTLSATEGYLTLLLTGEQTITLTAMTADGTTLTKSFTVNVDDLTEPVDPAYGYLCGTGSKKWTWQSADCYGNGNPSSLAPEWSKSSITDVDGMCVAKSLPHEGTNATMEFTLMGKKMVKKDADGNETPGTFNFEMKNFAVKESLWSWMDPYWSPDDPFAIGTMAFYNTNILFPYDINYNNAVVTNYYIVSLSDTELILAAITTNQEVSWYETFYWVFVPVVE